MVSLILRAPPRPVKLPKLELEPFLLVGRGSGSMAGGMSMGRLCKASLRRVICSTACVNRSASAFPLGDGALFNVRSMNKAPEREIEPWQSGTMNIGC